jgi:cytidyltransferase-like protein
MDKVMNLGKYLAQQLLEADQKTVAIFPGAFKPPHKGHLEVAKMLLKEADELIILISPILRDGIDADESVAVWKLYKLLLDGPAEIRVAAGSPIKETYEIVKNNPDTNFIVAFGKGEAERFKAMANYSNVKVFDGGYIQDANATQLRQALDSKDETAMQKYLPNGISPVDFLKAIGRKSTISPQEPTQLQEVQPMDATSPYHDLVVSELGEIDRTAQTFNVPINDLQYAFEAGRENILTDDVWSKLENSDSYQIKNLEQAIKLANKYKKDWRSIVRAIQNEKQLPLPLVLNYAKDKYYLVGGNTRLMFYKALGVQPIVLLGTIDLTIDEDSEVFDLNTIKLTESQTATVGEFIKYAIKNLAIQNPPRNLTFSYDNDQAKSKRSFGYFDPNDNKIWVYVKNRNMADILRTLAHELVHRKQAELGMLDNMSGETGSTIENEANAQAGVLLRDFGKLNDSIYEGLKKKLNELDFNLNKGYDWKFEGGVDNKYTFTTGQTEYEVLFFPVGISSKGVFERLYRPISEDNQPGTVPVTPTNEFKVLEINATVMNITIDFLNKNKQWKDVMISPMEKRRYNIVKGFLDKHLPLKYFKDEEEGIFHIYRKIK